MIKAEEMKEIGVETETETTGIVTMTGIGITEIKIAVIVDANTLVLAHPADLTDTDTIEIVKTTDVETPVVHQRKEAATITLTVADFDHDISLKEPTY